MWLRGAFAIEVLGEAPPEASPWPRFLLAALLSSCLGTKLASTNVLNAWTQLPKLCGVMCAMSLMRNASESQHLRKDSESCMTSARGCTIANWLNASDVLDRTTGCGEFCSAAGLVFVLPRTIQPPELKDSVRSLRWGLVLRELVASDSEDAP